MKWHEDNHLQSVYHHHNISLLFSRLLQNKIHFFHHQERWAGTYCNHVTNTVGGGAMQLAIFKIVRNLNEQPRIIFNKDEWNLVKTEIMKIVSFVLTWAPMKLWTAAEKALWLHILKGFPPLKDDRSWGICSGSVNANPTPEVRIHWLASQCYTEGVLTHEELPFNWDVKLR